MNMNETIAAIATAYGEGGIGIVRVSGDKSLEVLRRVFVPAKARELESRRMTYGSVYDDNVLIDEAMAVYMKGPMTYTGEDVAEIYCHGSVVSLRKTLEAVLKAGAIMAGPGEFTKRAFLNGRLDLSQAEAVIDLIKAKTDKSYEVAINQLEGSLSNKVKEIRKLLLDLLVDITVNIDYPDEDIEELTYDGLVKKLSLINDVIAEMVETADSGRMLREGIKIAIVGKPNVGKSSLMNGLLKEFRAIVTEIPGTTRDTIEEALSIRGIPVYLIDTAGIRETEDRVEKIGIEKSKQAFNEADYIIFVVDGSEDLSAEDMDIIEHLKERKALILINKQDKGNQVKMGDIAGILPNSDIIYSSLISGSGLKEVEDKIEELVYRGSINSKDTVLINNVRHAELLRKAGVSVKDAIEMAENLEAMDFIEIDVREAFDYLGEIIGETVSDEIINEVFARFCLGK